MHKSSLDKSRSQKTRPTSPSRPSSPEDWCLICCLPADAAGEPGGPLYYKEVLTRFHLEFFYPHDSERECDRTIGSFSHQSEITREQLSLPLASPPSPSGIRGILWVVQSIDLWLVSQPHFEGAMKYSTWSTWSAVGNRTSRAGELRSAPSGPDDWHRVAGKRALAPGVRVRRERAVK